MPAAEGEGGQRDDGEDDEAGAVLFAYAGDFRGTVENRDEVGVEGRVRVTAGAAGDAAEDEELCARAEALNCGGPGARGAGWSEGLVRVVPSEEV